jgi:hypothetical protein
LHNVVVSRTEGANATREKKERRSILFWNLSKKAKPQILKKTGMYTWPLPARPRPRRQETIDAEGTITAVAVVISDTQSEVGGGA